MRLNSHVDYLEVLQRGHQVHYHRVLERLSAYERQGGRALWISDQEPHWSSYATKRRSPDLFINSSACTHLTVALIITELIARECSRLIILEGPPRKFDQYYVRLRWICARFDVKLIVLGD